MLRVEVAQPRPYGAAAATASNSTREACPVFAYAHTVLERCCGLKSRSRDGAAAATASNSAGDACPAIAYAQTMVVSPHGL